MANPISSQITQCSPANDWKPISYNALETKQLQVSFAYQYTHIHQKTEAC